MKHTDPTPAEELCRLINQALTLPDVDPALPTGERLRAHDDQTALVLSRAAAVAGATAAAIDQGAVEYLREEIAARPVTYPTKESA